MSTYLEEAAAHLGKASAANELRGREAGAMHSGDRQKAAEILAGVSDRRLELAAAYTRLAAIAAGLPPCLGHPVPDPGQGPS